MMKSFFKQVKSAVVLDLSVTGPNKAFDLLLANFHSHYSDITFFSVGGSRNNRICILKHEKAFNIPVLVCHYLAQIFHNMPVLIVC